MFWETSSLCLIRLWFQMDEKENSSSAIIDDLVIVVNRASCR